MPLMNLMSAQFLVIKPSSKNLPERTLATFHVMCANEFGSVTAENVPSAHPINTLNTTILSRTPKEGATQTTMFSCFVGSATCPRVTESE